MKLSQTTLVLFSLLLCLIACDKKELQETYLSKDSKEKSTIIFVGEIVDIKNEIDGSTIKLKNNKTNDEVSTVVSIPNLGPESKLDFSSIKKGNLLKVEGEVFKLGREINITARRAFVYSPLKFASAVASIEEKQACLDLGGKVQKTGKAQFEHCIQNYTDADEPCSDSNQCFGECLMSTEVQNVKPGDSVEGFCSKTNRRFGCKPLVRNGLYEGTLCID